MSDPGKTVAGSFKAKLILNDQVSLIDADLNVARDSEDSVAWN